MQAWEDKFKENIDSLREKEMKWLAGVQFLKTYNSMVFWLSPVFVSTATFITCIFLGTPLTASNVFTALATLRIVQEPIRLVPDILAIIIQVSSTVLYRVVLSLTPPNVNPIVTILLPFGW